MRFRQITFLWSFFLLALFMARPVFAATNTDSMVGYWKFDETTQGTTAADSSGDSHPASPFGTGSGPAPTTDTPSSITFTNPRALDFNGSDQYLEVANNSAFNGSTYTIAFWAKFDAVNSTHQTLVGKWEVGVKQQYVIQLTNTNKIGFWTGDGSTGTSGALQSTLTPSQDTWYHITAVVNGTNRVLYINGTANKYTGTGTSPGSSTIELTIGSKKNSSGTYFEFLDGKIDDLRIYNRALSDTEVDALAAGNHTQATWDGSSSTNTETAANWDINAVPDPFTKLTISNVTTKPTATANLAVSGLTINSGSVLNLSTFNLTMNDAGTFSNDGTLALANSQTFTNFTNDTNSGTVLLNGTSTYTGLKPGNTYYNLILNDGLVGYWKLDETSGGSTVVDSSGYGNDGTPTGTSGSNNKPQPSTTISPVHFINSRSLSFDGTDDYVDCGSTPKALPTGSAARTIASWVKATSFADSDGKTVVGWGQDSGGVLSELRVNNASQVEFHGNGNDVHGSTTLSAGQWYHLATTVSSGGNVILYVNGVQDGTGSVSLSTTATNCKIGKQPDFPGQFFNGLIDDVRIYNRVLSATEIAALAAGDEPALTLASTTLDNPVTILGNFILNGGTLDVASGNNYGVTVGGNFENNGGVFTARAGTVTLNGTSQAINSSNSFYNLTKSVSSTDTLTLGPSATTTTSGTLTLSGAASNLLSLRSGTSGTAFNIDPQGNRNISYVDVQDSNNINAAVIDYSSTNTYGSNITNWTTTGPAPTPSPTSSSTSQASSSPSNASTPPSCSDTAPAGTPAIYQISATKNDAELYFTPVLGADSYFITYGTSTNANQFATSFSHSDSSGAIHYTIRDLLPGTTYYFSVRAGKGCATGDWSATKSTTTTSLISVATTQPNDTRTKKFVEEKISDAAAQAAQIPIVEKVVDKKIEVQKITQTEQLPPAPPKTSYIVKTGDSLWKIAHAVLGEGSKYKEIIAQNIEKYPGMLKGLKVGSELEIQKTEQATHIADASQNSYDLDVKIVNSSEQPLQGVKVTLHSTPRTEVTDNQGIAHFKDVERGDHKVYLVYGNYDGGGQSIQVTGDNKNVQLVMQVNMTNEFSSPKVWLIIGILLLIILLLLIIIFRKKLPKLIHKN